MEYYGTLLPLLKEGKEQTDIHLQRGEVYELMGKFDDAESDYRAASDSARDDVGLQASAQFALGKLSRLRGDYEPALELLAQAKEGRVALEDTAELAQVLIETGHVLWRMGEFVQARKLLNEGLALAREVGNTLNIALALNNLGNVALSQGDNIAARALHEQSLTLRREMGDKAGISASLTNLGIVARRQGDYITARAHYEQSLTLDREIGDKQGIASILNNLGLLTYSQGDLSAARALYEESLAIRREIGEKGGISNSLGNLGSVALALGDFAMARRYYEESFRLDREMDDKSGMAYGLHVLGIVGLAEGDAKAHEHLLQSLQLRQEIGEQFYQTSSLIGIAGLTLHEGNATRAAQMLGAVESSLKVLNATMEVEMLHFHAETLAAVREQLGESAFQSAWDEGGRWSLEEAVKRALDEES